MYQRLKRVASATNQSLEAVVFQTIRGNLPPSLDDLGADLRDLVTDLPALGDEELWAVVGESLPTQHGRRQRHLLRKAQAEALTVAEQTELAGLRHATDRYVIRRSYALALLKWRGHTLPVEP
jgi:hypothetical protein